jgi:hypothetical protein
MEARIDALARLPEENSTMRIFNLAGYTLSTSIAFSVLAGCSGSAQMTPTPLAQSGVSAPIQRPTFQNGRLNGFFAMRGGIVSGHGAARPSFMDSRAVGKPLVFVSYGGTIDIYLQGGRNKKVGQISTGDNLGGNDLATDAAGDLYSTNLLTASSSSSVTIYAPPYNSGPKLTIPVRGGGVIAISRQGTVAVGACTNPSGSQCDGGILFFAAGSATPCATVPLDAPFQNNFFGAAFDGKGNLYVDSSGSGTQAPLPVAKIAGGCRAKKYTTLTTANTIVYAGSLRVDKAGRIAILVATGTSPYTMAIDTYDPPKGNSLGSPVSTTSLPGGISSYAGTFAFQPSGRGLWAGVEGVGQSYASGASEFAYPAGGAPEKTVIGAPGSFTYGVAVSPALVP